MKIYLSFRPDLSCQIARIVFVKASHFCIHTYSKRITKKITMLLLAVLLIGKFAEAQFVWSNPKPSGFSNNKITFINRDTGYLFNANAELFQTTDRGITWTSQRRFFSGYAMDLKDSTGVIAGYFGTLYISSDNGKTWVTKSTGSTNNFQYAEVISRDTIILFDLSAGKILKTSNRGNTWQTTSTTLNNIFSADFVNANVGYATTAAGIFKTINGGTTWQNMYPVFSTSYVTTTKFFDADNGVVNRSSSNIVLRTSDGGLTWTSGSVNDKIFDFFYIDQNKIFAVAEYGMLYRSLNAGITWVHTNPGPRYAGYNLNTQYFFNGDTGIVAGSRGRILQTTNAGATLTGFSPTYSDINDISFGSNTVGFALNGLDIYKTANKGETWNKLAFQIPNISNSGTNQCLFFNQDTGIVASTYPARFFKTTDAGINWSVTTSLSGYDYVSGMSFINSSIGFAILRTNSAYGLFKTVDGGTSWNQVGSYQNLLKIQFFTELLGYATSGNSPGRLLKTTDGGNTWVQLLEFSNSDIKAFHFASPASGIAAGSLGNLKLTKDGGQNWTTVTPSGFYSDYFNIKFFNEQVGYFTADNNKIFKTVDSGATWQQYNQSSYPNCRAISYTTDSTVYLAGAEGTILTKEIWACDQAEFTGAVSNYWHEPANWSCGLIPRSSSNVVILFDTVIISGTATCRSIDVRPGANLVIQPGSTLNIMQ